MNIDRVITIVGSSLKTLGIYTSEILIFPINPPEDTLLSVVAGDFREVYDLKQHKFITMNSKKTKKKGR